ncbi:MAG: Gfo/Idh/MocA family oxidoreductase [Saprospiraceae bacterium]|nr:Gfo/Idh/MocA family oxidoreductase [Saprospiraceae bacterium]
MKQIIQDLKNGETLLVESPAPSVRKGHVLIRTHYTLVSSGTERMLLNFGKAGWIEKARQQPDKVQQVISKIRIEGLFPTIDAVLKKLDAPIALGYCNAGEVIEVADDVTEFKVGDRVISNGHHSEIVCVGKNLVAKIPDSVSYEEAVFTVIGAIGLQGIRLVQPSLGETVVVQGLGLIGLLTVQLLKHNGCKVIGIETDIQRIKLAESFGIACIASSNDSNVVNEVLRLTNDQGADAVLITASSKSNELISQAAQMSRKRGKIVLIGVVGLDIQRSDFYEKELSFQVSCSYGPGRYDDQYEKFGIDYPLAYVRWTEKRNFEAVLDAMQSGALHVKSLITEIESLDNYGKIYSNLATAPTIASLLKYDHTRKNIDRRITVGNKTFKNNSSLIGVIGSGNFTSGVMLPLLHKLNAPIKTISSASGLTATQLAKKYNIPVVSTDYSDVLEDVDSQAVIITTRHNSHATLVTHSLRNNKHILVEKPLCIHESQLEDIIQALENTSGSLMVGYNRRFSPAAKLMFEHFQKSNQPIQLSITMNSGKIAADHWIQNMEIGGGRIIGEACHAIDLAGYLCNSLAKEVYATSMDDEGIGSDNVSILIKYSNGSTAIIHYLSTGSKDYPKERIEAHQNGTTAIIDNFKSLQFFGSNSKSWSGTQDKGHKEQYRLWLKFVEEGGVPPISVDSLLNTSKVSFGVLEAIRSGGVVRV